LKSILNRFPRSVVLGVALRIAVGVVVLAFLWAFTLPDKPVFQVCGFHWLTGRPCPLCGMTRAFFALAKGQWVRAVHFNALSPLAFVMLAQLFWTHGPTRDRLWTFGLAAFAVYGICRVFVPTL